MMKSPLGKMLGAISWVITALASINMGLMPFGFNFFTTGFMMRMSWLMMPLHYIIGLAGVYSLILLFTMCKCGKLNCDCK